LRPALLILAAYLIGAFPTSFVVGKLTRGIDLRQHGSKNLGATNAFRVLGWRAAIPVFIVDVMKGFLPTAFFPAWDQRAAPEWALAYGAAAIIGHIFSIYVGFKGGKGVATGAGVFLALAPVAIAVSMAVWIAVLLLSGYVSLASIISAMIVPIVVLLLQGVGPVFALALALALFIVYAHRANIRRLTRGEEHRFRRGTEPGV
jgi:glycerol-3-phosphate acyltransferase PlsY